MGPMSCGRSDSALASSTPTHQMSGSDDGPPLALAARSPRLEYARYTSQPRATALWMVGHENDQKGTHRAPCPMASAGSCHPRNTMPTAYGFVEMNQRRGAYALR